MVFQEFDPTQTIGSYQVIKRLGVGGMGVVYQAKHIDTGQLVALKTVKIPNAAMVRGIRREIDALARIEHPGIVRILAHGLSTSSLPWYAMEFLEGQTLRQWESTRNSSQKEKTLLRGATIPEKKSPWWTNSLAITQQMEITKSFSDSILDSSRKKPFRRFRPHVSPKDVTPILSLLVPLCSTLAYLHGEGILHRDLKPDNILINVKGVPVLMDFGIANFALHKDGRENLAGASPLGGTPFYMSPEQIRKEPLDARSDLYALGVILYELLTKRIPFQKTDLSALLQAHLEETPPKPSDWVSSLPKALDDLVMKLLAKRREDRPGYAEDIAKELLALGANPSPLSCVPSSRPYLYKARLAGRLNILHPLQQSLQNLEHQKGSIVLLSGKGGVGKTRLLAELAKEVAKSRHKILVGDCLEAPTPLSLSPFRKPLQDIVDRCLEKGKLESERIFGKRGKVLQDYCSSLTSLPGQDTHPQAAELPFDAAKLRLFSYLEETLLAYAENKPFVLFLEDLHWADELSLDFLVQGNLLTKHILVVATFRSDELSPQIQSLLAQKQMKHLEVGTLTEEEIAQMVGDMLALAPPPSDFSRFLFQRSGGNPFFVSEFLKTAVEESLLWRDKESNWQIAKPSERVGTELDYQNLGLPQSLQLLLNRSLAGLSKEARHMLEAAAVLGQEFSWNALERIVPQQFKDVSELLRRGIWEEINPEKARFVQDQLRKMLLSNLGESMQLNLHQKAAKALVEEFGEEGREGELGYHWEKAKEFEIAKRFYLAGAHRAVTQYHHQEAEGFYRAYLDLETTPSPARLHALLQLGKVLQSQGDNQDALQLFEQLFQEATSLQNLDMQESALRWQGEVHRHLGDIKTALQKLNEGRSFRHNLKQHGVILQQLSILYYDLGETNDFNILTKKSLQIARQIKDTKSEGRILNKLAIHQDDLGNPEEAKRFYQQALAIACQTADRRNEASIRGNLAILSRNQGNMDEAHALYQRALEIFREIGDVRNEGNYLGNFGNFYVYQGKLEEAKTLYQEAFDISERVGDFSNKGIVSGNLAIVYQTQGYLEEAEKYFQKSLQISYELKKLINQGVTLVNLACLYHQQGFLEKAQQCFQESLSIFKQLGQRKHRGNALTGLANLLRQSEQNFEESEKLFQQAEPLLRDSKDKLELGKLLCQWGHLALAQEKDATPFLKEAKEFARELDAGPESELGQLVHRLHRAKEAFVNKETHRLFRGELWEDIPQKLQKTLQKTLS